MHHASGVNYFKPFSQPCRQVQHRRWRQRPEVMHPVGERRPVHVGSNEPRLRAVHISAYNRHGVDPADRPRGRDFPRKPRPELCIPSQFGPDHLDRDQSPAWRLAKIDVAHTALA